MDLTGFEPNGLTKRDRDPSIRKTRSKPFLTRTNGAQFPSCGLRIVELIKGDRPSTDDTTFVATRVASIALSIALPATTTTRCEGWLWRRAKQDVVKVGDIPRHTVLFGPSRRPIAPGAR